METQYGIYALANNQRRSKSGQWRRGGAQRCKHRGEALKKHRNLEIRWVAEEQQRSSSEAGVEAAFAPASVARPVKSIFDSRQT